MQVNLNALMKYERNLIKNKLPDDGLGNLVPSRTSSLSRILLSSSKSSLPNDLDDNQKGIPQSYSLIILDLNMPIMNGYEACTKIRTVFDDLDRLREGYVPLV